jgi:hypothetical protein
MARTVREAFSQTSVATSLALSPPPTMSTVLPFIAFVGYLYSWLCIISPARIV